MKRIFTFIFLFCCVIAASAQGVEDNDSYRFIDESGKELEPGAFIDVTEGAYDDIEGGYVMKVPVSIINKAGEQDMSIRLKCEIVNIDNGAFKTCWPENCVSPWDAKGTYYGAPAKAYAKKTSKDITSEWVCDDTKNGTAAVKMTIEQGEGSGNNFDCYYYGPSLTVYFYKGVKPTSVKGILNTADTKTATYYTIDGRMTTSQAKGLKIVRLSNGKVIKQLK